MAPALLAAGRAGRLPRRLADAVDRHLAGCAECRRQFERAGPASATSISAAPADAGDTEPGSAPTEHRHIAAELAGHPDLEFLGWIGAGGMGSVFLARQRLLDRKVAVKVLHPRMYDRRRSRERLQAEIKAVARLDHPHIVAAYTAEEYRGRLLFVMEYVEGASLREYLGCAGPLPAAEACDYVRQAALGLQHAHEAGLVHRDVKPHNLILTPQGRVKVLDFGLARARDREGGEGTGPGAMMGTADYVAPEQALDAARADARSDLYALGCTLYHALAGRVPFPDASPTEKVARHVGVEPADLAALRPDLPADLVAVVRRMMAKDPAKRYRSAAEVVAALAPFAPDRPAARGSSRRRWLVAGGAAAVLLAGAGLASGPIRRWLRGPGPVPPPPQLGDVVLEPAANDNLVATAYSPDGTRIVGGGDGATLFVWDAQTGKSVAAPRAHADRINFVAFSADGAWAASVGEDAKIVFWETAGWTVRLRSDVFKLGVEAIAFAPDGSAAYAADGGAHLAAIGLPDGKPRGRWPQTDFSARGKGASAVVVSPDGRTLYLGLGVWHDEPKANPNDGEVVAADAATGKQAFAFPGVTASVISLALSKDGTRLAAAGLDGKVHVWDTAERKLVQTFAGHTHICRSVAFAPDGRRLASSSFDGTVRLWELGRAEPVASLKAPRTGRFNHLAFSPDGTRLAGGGRNGVAVWLVG